MKRLYVTVDTECHDISRINQYIYGKDDNGEYHGLPMILKLGRELNIPINFILDVSECHRYGDKYIQEIVDLIHSYNQPIYFHFHPNFLSGEDDRSYLWQYSKEEQQHLIKEGVADYYRFCGKQDRLIFRAGRYGINNDTLEILSQLDVPVVDLSYSSGNGKGMCHVSRDEIGFDNIPSIYKNVTVLPNTSYVGFDYLGRKNGFILNVAQTPTAEFKTFVKKTGLHNVIYTMHSWDFILKWFFCKDKVWGNDNVVQRFKDCIQYAQSCGYVLSKLEDFSIQEDDKDELLNLCENPLGKIRGLFYNYSRFWGIAHLTRRYFIIYIIFYTLLALMVLGVIMTL